MILIFQTGLIKPNQKKIIKVIGLFLKLWDNGDL